MAGCNELKELIELELLPDLEEAIDELFEAVADAKNADEEAKAEYAEMQELRAAFQALLNDLNEGELNEEECTELHDELEKMIEEGTEEDV
ncbi:hypothetical protein [Hydrogenimonas sp. SS33]|uniref:hypothetical protein n=1 Tax=Hydrogenimonas leucolamina TaxID=2954236 RepID=UPI00336C0FFF